MIIPYKGNITMTKEELLEFYIKLSKRLDILEEAAAILTDEPFASKEPDNDVFCDALQMRIERIRAVAAAARRDLFSKEKEK